MTQTPDQPDDVAGYFEHWLNLLRDGTDDEKSLARTEIGLILEARGQIEAAADAYLTNVKLRVRDPRPYERLAAICRASGDVEQEARVLLALHSVLAEQTHTASSQHSARPKVRVRPIVAIAMVVSLILVGIGTGIVAYRISTSYTVRQTIGRILRPPTPVPPLPIPPTPTTPTPITRSGLPCYDPIGHFPEWADPENSVLQAAIVTFGNTRHSGNPGALAIWRVALDDPEPTLAGWMAAELVARHSGNPGPSLSRYVEESTIHRMALAFAYKSMRDPVIWRVTPRADWDLLFHLPASNCTGAMLQHPANTRLVRLMSAAVLPAATP